MIKLVSACLLSLSLTGCFDVQLNGSIADSQLSVTPLRQPDNVVKSAVSLGPENWAQSLGTEEWEQLSGLLKLLFVGIANVKIEGVDPNALYLVTASGGEDYDAERKLALSDIPEAVQGSWHAIVTGQRLLDGNIKVSPLTEALYLQVLPRLGEWNDAQVLARLDASAQLTVTDVDKNDVVNYADVVSWSRFFDAAKYRGDLSALNALADSISAGQPTTTRTELSKAVLGSESVVMSFDVGDVTLETYNWDSPITAANFLNYVRDGFYDQMVVHRAINNFMIQAGLLDFLGLNDQGQVRFAPKAAGDPIVNESSNGLSNLRGTMAMARTSNPDSATAQWFINQANNTFLDNGSSQNPDGYAVFARVTSGIGIVDQIAGEPTVTVNSVGNDVPSRGVILESVVITE
ncbi:MAG: peptidylprolyl isomerase [Halioglobus sp.]